MRYYNLVHKWKLLLKQCLRVCKLCNYFTLSLKPKNPVWIEFLECPEFHQMSLDVGSIIHSLQFISYELKRFQEHENGHEFVDRCKIDMEDKFASTY